MNYQKGLNIFFKEIWSYTLNIPYTFSEATESETRTKNPATETKNTATGTKNTPLKPLTDGPDIASDQTAKTTTTAETTTTSSEKSTQTGLDHPLTSKSTSSGLELRPYLAMIIAVLVIWVFI